MAIMIFQREGGKVDKIINRVSAVMGEKRMRIKDLAEKAGITHYTASQYWSGKVQRVDLDVLAKICRALECQVGDLFIFEPNGREKTGDA